MKKNTQFYWLIFFGVLLLTTSATVYLFHYMIFRDAHHIFLYLIGDIGFVPLEVILITMVFHKFLLRKEKHVKFEKLNAVVGVFFTRVGNDLIQFLSQYDLQYEETKKFIDVHNDWTTSDFDKKIKEFRTYKANIDTDQIPLSVLQRIIKKEESLILQVFGNTDMLDSYSLAYLFHTMFHLIDNLDHSTKNGRTSLHKLDINVEKLYTFLIYRWLHYTKHISEFYPHHYPTLVNKHTSRKNLTAQKISRKKTSSKVRTKKTAPQKSTTKKIATKKTIAKKSAPKKK